MRGISRPYISWLPRPWRFSTVQKFTNTRAQLLKMEESTNLNEFSNQLMKVYVFDQMSKSFNIRTEKTINRIALLNPEPFKNILAWYFKYSRQGFDDALLASVVRALGRAMKCARLDHHLHQMSLEPREIFASDHFTNVKDEIRYALKGGVYINPRNLMLIIDGLIDMEYVDKEICDLIYNKIYSMVTRKEVKFTIDDDFRKNPHLEKRYFYLAGDLIDTPKLLNNPQFDYIYNTLTKQQEARLKSKQQEERFQAAAHEIFGVDSEEIAGEIQKIRKQVKLTRENLTKFVDALISIRNKYYQMCKAQHATPSILTDPNMNLGLLELQEQLLNLNLINLQEVQNIELLVNQQHNLQQVNKIAQKALKNNTTGQISSFLQELIVLESVKPKQIQLQVQKLYNQHHETLEILACCLGKLSELVCLPVRDVNTVDLMGGPWSKNITNKFPDIFENNAHQFLVDRMFKTRYVDLVNKVSRNLTQMTENYLQTQYKTRMRFAQALLKIGFYHEAKSLIVNYRAPRESFATFNHEELFCIIHVYCNLAKEIDHTVQKQRIMARLEKDLESGELFKPVVTRFGTEQRYGLYEKCTIINWLVNVNETSSELYKKLVAALMNDVKGVTNPENVKDYGYAAAILKWHYPGIREPSNSPFNFKIYYNPIIKIFQTALHKYLNIPTLIRQNSPFIQTGYINFESSIKKVVFFVPSSLSGLDDKSIDGNLQAYITLFGQHSSLNITCVPNSQLLKLQFPIKNLTIAEKPILQNLFNTLLRKVDDPLVNFVNNLSKSLLRTAEYRINSHRTHMALNKLIKTLQTIQRCNTIEKTSGSYNVALANRYKIIYLLAQLPKQIALLDKDAYIDFSYSYSQKGINVTIQDLISKLTLENIKFQEGLAQHSFVGKRQSIELADPQAKSDQDFNIIDFQIIDQEVHSDKSYCLYDSWTEKLINNFGELNCSQLEIEKCSLLTKAFLFNRVNSPKTFSISPSWKPRVMITSAHPLEWQAIFQEKSSDQLTQAQRIEKLVREPVNVTPELLFIAQLQNFKLSLKSRCITEVCELLTRFDFIQELIKQHLKPDNQSKPKKLHLAPRNAADYFNYLRIKSINHVTNSPYLSYLFSKLEKSNKVQEMFELLETTKQKAKLLIRTNKLTFEQYTQARKQIQNKIIQEIESFENEIVDNQVTLGANTTTKMFHPEINYKQISKFISKGNFYRPNLDDDVIVSGGDYDQALKVKRIRSQSKLIKTRILYKIGYKIQLTNLEKEYLTAWKEKKLPSVKRCTDHTLSQLSENDQKILSEYSQLPSHKEFGLTELILEFALFFDDKAVENFQRQINNEFLKNKYKIPEILFEGPTSKASSYFLNQMERRQFDSRAKLSDSDIENVLKISQFLKTENPFDRKMYNKIYHDARQDIDKLNQSGGRIHLIAAWSAAKDREFDLKYEADKNLKNNKEDIIELWQKHFGLDYNTATTVQVGQFTNQLCERLYILKKNPPVYFSPLIMSVLLHPNILDADRKNLLGTLELLKIDVNFVSSDIIAISRKLHAATPLAQDQLTDRLHKSNRNVARELLSASSY